MPNRLRLHRLQMRAFWPCLATASPRTIFRLPVRSGRQPGRQMSELEQVKPLDFNSYGSRRGNHEVMMRGTFANIRIRNHMARAPKAAWQSTSRQAAKCRFTTPPSPMPKMRRRLVVFAGKEYGTGSSRDWAAKHSPLGCPRRYGRALSVSTAPIW